MRLTPTAAVDRVALGALVLAFVLAGLAFAVGTPLFQNPDEPTHVDMARYYAAHPADAPGPSLRQTLGVRKAVAATGLRDEPRPPDFTAAPSARPNYESLDDYGGDRPATTGCPVTCQNYQYAHPPGWYLVVAPVTWLVEQRDFPALVLALRMVDVLMSALLVWSSWYIARQIWPARPRLALVAAAMTALFAPLAASAAAANNDALVFALMAVTLALMARVLCNGADAVPALLLGCAVGLGLLTKGEFLAVAPIAFIALIVAPVRTSRWRPTLLFLLPAGLGAVWWLRVLVDTHSLTPAGSELVAIAPNGYTVSSSIWSYSLDRLPEFLGRFPGFYGWGYVTASTPMKVAFDIVLVGTPIVWLATRPWGRVAERKRRVVVLALVPLSLTASALVSSYATFAKNGEIRGMAPRYVYGALPVFAVGLVAVAAMLARRLRLKGTIVFPLGIIASGVGAVASFWDAMRGQYASDSLSVIAGRADVVAPVDNVSVHVIAIATAWVACLLVATTLIMFRSRLAGTVEAAQVRARRTRSQPPKHAARSRGRRRHRARSGA